MTDRTFYRLTLAALAALSLVFGVAGSAGATTPTTSPHGAFERTYLTCATTYRTNKGRIACHSTAPAHGKRYATVVRWDAATRCHVTYWRYESRHTTKGEATRAVCWERGRFVTYAI